LGTNSSLKLIATLSFSLFVLMVLILSTILPAAFAAHGQFNAPFGVGIDSSGNVYVTDSGNNRIQKFKNSGTFIRTWGTFGTLAQTQASSINPFGESETNPFQVFGDNTGMSTLLSKLNKH